jgi:hypothetical protein
MDREQVVHAELLRVVAHIERELRDVRQRATLVLVALAVVSGLVAPGTIGASNGNLSGWAYTGGIAGGVCLVLLLAAMGPGAGPGFVTDPLALAREHAEGDLRQTLAEHLAGRMAATSAALHSRGQMLQLAVLSLGISTVAWLVAVGKL